MNVEEAVDTGGQTVKKPIHSWLPTSGWILAAGMALSITN
jgi:hypothetical protein